MKKMTKIEIDARIEALKKSSDEAAEIAPELQEQIANLNSQIAEARISEENAKKNTNEMKNQLVEVQEKLDVAQKFQAEKYQIVIKELFETPAEDIKKNIERQSFYSAFITIVVSAAAIIFSVIFATYFQMKSEESSDSIKVKLEALGPLVKSTNTAISSLNYTIASSTEQFNNDMRIINLDAENMKNTMPEIQLLLEQLNETLVGTLKQIAKDSKETNWTVSQMRKKNGNAEIVKRLVNIITTIKGSYDSYQPLLDLRTIYLMHLRDEAPEVSYKLFLNAFNESKLSGVNVKLSNLQEWDGQHIKLLDAMLNALRREPDKKALVPKELCNFNYYKEQIKQDYHNWGYKCDDSTLTTIGGLMGSIKKERKKRIANRLKRNK